MYGKGEERNERQVIEKGKREGKDSYGNGKERSERLAWKKKGKK